ncbi:MAG: DUF547 domain-containing protein [Aureispira sp.]
MIVLLLTCISFTLFASPTNVFNKSADQILGEYVHDGLVDYKALHQVPGVLDNAVNKMEKVKLSDLSEDEKKAFLLNAYNLLVIKTIAENYPVTSPLEIEGFFDKKTFWINNREVTLNEIEHKVFYLSKDPLVHFGLVCAARGCPLLNNTIFTPDEVNTQLEIKATQMLDDANFLIEDKGKNIIYLSFIFKWNAGHFSKDLISFVNKYKTIKVSEYATIEYYNYDWELNEK